MVTKKMTKGLSERWAGFVKLVVTVNIVETLLLCRGGELTVVYFGFWDGEIVGVQVDSLEVRQGFFDFRNCGVVNFND